MKREAGFTLVELAIVLVIIGIILGMVLKGQDLIRGAHIKQYYTKFVNAWEIAFYDYQDRTGYVLGDTVDNGGSATSGTEDGFADATLSTMPTMCSTILPKAGLTPPTTNTSECYQETISGRYVTERTQLVIDSAWVNGNRHNVLRIYYVPTDVALALDKIIDGKDNSTSGNFQQIYPAPPGTGIGGWSDPTTQSYVTCIYILD